MVRALSIALVFAAAALSLALFAQHPSCGTDWDTTLQVEYLHRAHRGLQAQASPLAELRDGIFRVPRSEAIARFDRPNDLAGKSLRFTPSDGDRYLVAVEPLRYEDEIGTELRAFSAGSTGWHYVEYDLQSLTLPLFGQSVQTIYVTAFNGIALTPPRISGARQLDRVEAAITPEPTIAPLLMSANLALALPVAWIRETSDAVIVTWRSSSAKFAYDIQAKIGKTGEIVFSYRLLDQVSWGAVTITPGASWLGTPAAIASAQDAADDAALDVPAAFRHALDLRSVSVERFSGTGVYRIAATLGAIPGSVLPTPGDGARMSITIGDAPPMLLTLGYTGESGLLEPGRAIPGSSVASIDGSGVRILFFADVAGPFDGPQQIVVETSLLSMSVAIDRVVLQAPIEAGEPPDIDLSAADGLQLALPIVEAFTLPWIDLEEVWEIVREAGRLSDSAVDAVAIYQNFSSDIVLYAGAYAAGGNAGADGVSMYVSKRASLPRSPTLMHMNAIDSTGIQDPRLFGRTLLHELGHRWLHFVGTIENGSLTISLNPAPAHPPQWASLPAAFPVRTAYDTSTMGGGVFFQNGNSFTSAAQSPYGYSWLDLYLMGLATPEEVPPMYYIANASPALGDSYNPPGNVTVTGTRRDVTIQQVIAAMGPRTPQDQRTFQVVFVLVGPEPSSNQLERLHAYRRAFEENFASATGNRGVVRTLVYPAVRRRSVRSE